MRLRLQFSLTILIISLSIGSAWADQVTRRYTKTLMPIVEKSVGEHPEELRKAEKLLWIQKGDKTTQKGRKRIHLRFDLSSLPSGLAEADFKECTLRLVAKTVVFQPDGVTSNTGGTRVRIRGWLAKNDNDFSPTQNEKSIIALSVLSEKKQPVTLNEKTTDAFRKAVYHAYSGDKMISLRLFTNSDRASSLFYSSENFGDSPSKIPRLVIVYIMGPPTLPETLSWAQHQQNPEHTGRNPWIPFKNPIGFIPPIKIPTNGFDGTIADYPLIYRGNIYLVNKVEKNNYLVALDFKGKEIWRKDIGTGTVQRSPVISRGGIFYTVTEDKITGYDLNRFGRIFTSYPEPEKLTGKLSDYTDLTIGNDGSLFLAFKENGLNYVYGFTPELKPFLKSGPYGKGQDKISTVTVSPDGGKIFAQTPKGAVVIDITDPSQEQSIELQHEDEKALEYYHVPVGGPAGGIMIFSDFRSSANEGNVWGYTANKRIWSTSGTLTPQPVLGSNDLVYFIQGGALQRHTYNKYSDKDEKPFPNENLNTTSNLVMDGANNIYFWNNGFLHGYSSKGESLFKEDFTAEGLNKKRPVDTEVSEVIITDGGKGYTKAPTVTFTGDGGSGAVATAVIKGGSVSRVEIMDGGKGYTKAPKVTFTGGGGSSAKATTVLKKEQKEGKAPEQFIRLMLAPDGTLWANNKNGNSLFAFKPHFAEDDITLKQEDIQTKTVYRATGKITVGSLTLKDGTQILLQAQKNIAFSKGFTVKKGASLLCRTGF